MRTYLKYLASSFLGMAIICFMVTVLSFQLSIWNHWIFLLMAVVIGAAAMETEDSE